MVFPLNESVIRHSASLHWLPRATVRQLHRYYQSAPTSRHPSQPALFHSPAGTTDFSSSRGSGELPLAGSSSELRRCLNPLPSTHTRGDDGISQVPRQPLCEHALLFDPGGPDTPRPLTTYPMLPSVRLTTSAPRSVTFRGSITRPVRSLSTLRGSDYSDRHRARLATHWRPTLLGQDSHLLGCIRRFPLCASSHIVSSSSKLFLAHQPP